MRARKKLGARSETNDATKKNENGGANPKERARAAHRRFLDAIKTIRELKARAETAAANADAPGVIWSMMQASLAVAAAKEAYDLIESGLARIGADTMRGELDLAAYVQSVGNTLKVYIGEKAVKLADARRKKVAEDAAEGAGATPQ